MASGCSTWFVSGFANVARASSVCADGSWQAVLACITSSGKLSGIAFNARQANTVRLVATGARITRFGSIVGGDGSRRTKLASSSSDREGSRRTVCTLSCWSDCGGIWFCSVIASDAAASTIDGADGSSKTVLACSTFDGELSSSALDAADARNATVFVAAGAGDASFGTIIGSNRSRKTILAEVASNGEGTSRTWVAIDIKTANNKGLMTVIAANTFACSDTERNRRTGTRDAAGTVGRKLSGLTLITSSVVDVWLKSTFARNAFRGSIVSRDAALGTGLAGLTVGREGSSKTLSAV